MDKKPLIWKCLVIGIIFLFLGTTLSQAITINTHLESITNNINLDTSEEKSIVSFQYFTSHGVEQIEREISLQDSNRISKLMSGSDIEALAYELTNLGLVPSSINLEQLRELISGEYGKKAFAKYTDNLNHFVLGDYESNRNIFCSVNGEAYSYISRNLRTQLVYCSALALIILDLILHLLIVYPLKTWMELETAPGVSIKFGIFGLLGWILFALPELMDIIPVKFSMFQMLVLEAKPFYPALARLNTSSIFEKWELSGNYITLVMMGFLGIWATIQNPQDDFTKFRGFSMFIYAEND